MRGWVSECEERGDREGVEVKGGVTERGVEVRECEERGDTEK